MSELTNSQAGLGNKTKIGWRHLRHRILLEQRSRAQEESEELGHLREKAEECGKGLGGQDGEPEVPPEGTGEP